MDAAAKVPLRTGIARLSTLQKIRDAFKDCSEGTGNNAHVNIQALARYLHRLVEAEQCHANQFGPRDKQVIALCACQMMQDMDLKGRGRIGIEEWIHHMLLAQAQIPALKVSSQIDMLLRPALEQYPRLLEDLQKMFWAADVANEGCLSLRDIVDMYRRKLWLFSPTHPRGLLSEAELCNTAPEDSARNVLEAMDLNSTGTVSYAEFMVYCLGRRKSPVALHYYDLSKGAASAISPWLLGQRLDGLWHTGVVVYGKEYFFGGDICLDTPGTTAFGEPTKVIELGFTLWRQEELHNYVVDELRPFFNKDVYDIVLNNCNHFADRVCVWLTGLHLPAEVVQQPEKVMQLRAARMLRPVLNRWLGNIEANPAAAKALGAGSVRVGPLAALVGKAPLIPGMVVSFTRPEGEERTLGTVIAAPQGIPVQQQQSQDSCWVRFLKVHLYSSKRSSRTTLCTELIAGKNLAVVRLDALGQEGAYQSALRAMMPQSVVGATPKHVGTSSGNGVDSCDQKPKMSAALDSSCDEESPNGSPLTTPRLLAGDSREAFKQVLDSLAVPTEAKLHFEPMALPQDKPVALPGASAGAKRMQLEIFQRKSTPPKPSPAPHQDAALVAENLTGTALV